MRHARTFFAKAPSKGFKKVALEITSVMTEIEFIHLLLPPLNLRRNLEQNLLDHDSKCKDCECHSAYVKHRSGSVFDKSSDEVMSEIRTCDESYPVRTKQTKESSQQQIK